MNYETTLRVMMDSYPSLHATELDALDQLFFTTGNGYEWENGELVSCDDDPSLPPDEVIRQTRVYNRKQDADMLLRLLDSMEQEKELLSHLSGDVARTYAEGMLQRAADLKEEARANQADNPELDRALEIKKRLRCIAKDESTCFFVLPDGSMGRVIRLSQYSDILHVPEDVKPDWLAAAKKAIALTKTHGRIEPGSEEYFKQAEALLAQR